MKKYQSHIQYALIQASIWGLYGVLLSYAQNYLLGKNFSNIIVSGILSAASVCSVIFQIILTEFVNKSKRITLTMVTIALSTMILFASAILQWIPISPVGIAAAYGLGVVGLQILPAFANAMGMSAIQSGKNVNFGVARGIGSGAYAVISFLVGRWIISMGYNVILIVTMILCIMLSYTSFIFTRKQKKEIVGQEMSENLGLLQFLIYHKKFTVFLLGCMLCSISH